VTSSEATAAAAPELPRFSIVVPTYERPGRLSACIEGIAHLDYPRDSFELIVVDDGESAGPTGAREHAGLSFTLLRQPHAGPATARNTGASQARNDWLVFIDDDCVPEPDYLQVLARTAAKFDGKGIGGRTTVCDRATACERTAQGLTDFFQQHYNTDARDARFVTSNNLALPRARFDSIGGFDERFPVAAGEDRDLSDRWLRAGFGLVFAPDAVVRHCHSMTFGGFWRQQFNYGRGAAVYHQLRRSREALPGEESGGLYAGLIRHAGRLAGSGALDQAALTATSQLAVACGYLSARFAPDASAPAVES
jgi:glycosyltransferase involved in cell wall biosynthesis